MHLTQDRKFRVLSSLLLVFCLREAGAVKAHASSTVIKGKESDEIMITIRSTNDIPILSWNHEGGGLNCKPWPERIYNRDSIWKVVKSWDCTPKVNTYLLECPALEQRSKLRPEFLLTARITRERDERPSFECKIDQEFQFEFSKHDSNIAYIIGGIAAMLLLFIYFALGLRKHKSQKSKKSKKKKSKRSKKERSLDDVYDFENGYLFEHQNFEDDEDLKPYLKGYSARRRPKSKRIKYY